MIEEKWVHHPKFTKYRVYSDGRIYSEKSGKFLSAFYNNKGYKRVDLWNDDGKSCKFVHRLVIESFNGLDEKMVNHKDGNKTNNNLDNLEYCTQADNLKHAFLFGLNSHKGVKNAHSKLTEDDVIEIRKLCNAMISTKEIAEKFNVSTQAIGTIKHRKTWAHVPEPPKEAEL